MNLHGKFIKHKKFMDVCFEVKKSFDVGHKVKLKGNWWNMAFVKSFDIFHGCRPSNIEIRKENYGEWEYCTNPQSVDCLRNAQWKSILPKSEPLSGDDAATEP
jgi:hypothetical protein